MSATGAARAASAAITNAIRQMNGGTSRCPVGYYANETLTAVTGGVYQGNP
jgi:hypothetical protein